MQEQIQTSGVHLPFEIDKDIHTIISENEDDDSPFMKLMREEPEASTSKTNGLKISPHDYAVLLITGIQVCICL